MRSLGLLLTASLLSAAAPPPPARDFQPFEQALAGSHFNDASDFIDRLMAERLPADGKPRPDPWLNALLGRLYLAAGNVASAAAYFDGAPLAQLPAPIRAATALDRGRVLELRGEREASLAAYREGAAASTTDLDRRRAALGISRQLLPVDPKQARDTVAAIADGPPVPERWEAKYLLALSASLLGDAAAASRLADAAWADSVHAPLNALGPLRVAALRAALAAARHDVVAERAMLLATNGLKLTAAPELRMRLPACGEHGLRPSDYVIFAYFAGPYVNRGVTPVAASRLEAVGPFTDAIGKINPIKEGTSLAPLGTTFTVSCRSVGASRYLSRRQDPFVEWFVSNGIYPASASFEADDQHINAIADHIDATAARFGKDSPLLIGPRWQMSMVLEKRARAGDQVLPGQIADLATQIGAGMRRSGAPEWMTAAIEMRASFDQAAAAARDGPDQAARFAELSRQQLLSLPFAFSRDLLTDWLRNLKEEDWPAPVAQLVLDLNAKAPRDLAGPERHSWLLLVGQAQRSLGKDAEARATIASAGFAPDTCALADSSPTLLEQHFSYADYPHDLVAGSQEGAVLFEFDLSPAGTVAGRRVVYSLPSGIFDEASAKGLSTVRFTQPTRKGKPSMCRGMYQPIVWRLEDSEDFTVPVFSPGATEPTS